MQLSVMLDEMDKRGWELLLPCCRIGRWADALDSRLNGADGLVPT
jgi:hypothetical protein